MIIEIIRREMNNGLFKTSDETLDTSCVVLELPLVIQKSTVVALYTSYVALETTGLTL